MTFSWVWAKSRLFSCCSLILAKHLIIYHHISCWSNCETWDSPDYLLLGNTHTFVVARSVFSLASRPPASGKIILKFLRARFWFPSCFACILMTSGQSWGMVLYCEYYTLMTFRSTSRLHSRFFLIDYYALLRQHA